jgi:hypothetical protein
MAAWQFDLYFILRDAQAPNLDAEGWDAPSLPLPKLYEIQKELAHYMGPPWLMLPDWLVFGPENGNRIDVNFETEDSGSIFVRCDVRQEAAQFLVLICNLAHAHGCRLFNPQSRRLIEPSFDALKGALAGN